jgi:hypothetical protein
MSVPKPTSGRRASGKQVPDVTTSAQAAPSSSAPTTVRTVNRPFPRPLSANSSVSSNTSCSTSSSGFDAAQSTPFRDESPTTPPDDLSMDSASRQTATKSGIFGEPPKNSGSIPFNKNRVTKVPRNAKKGFPSIGVDASTISKSIFANKPRSKTSRSSFTLGHQESHDSFDKYLSVRDNSSTRPRASSAPSTGTTLRHLQEQDQKLKRDIDHLPGLPGRYESQDSNFDIEIDTEAGEERLRIALDEVDNYGVDTVPYLGYPTLGRPETQIDAPTAQDDQVEPGDEIEMEASLGSGAPNQREPEGSRSEYQRPNFVPFECDDDDPTKHKSKEIREINGKILKFIRQGHTPPTEPGWVYMYNMNLQRLKSFTSRLA